jgi:hypothetical protein
VAISRPLKTPWSRGSGRCAAHPRCQHQTGSIDTALALVTQWHLAWTDATAATPQNTLVAVHRVAGMAGGRVCAPAAVLARTLMQPASVTTWAETASAGWRTKTRHKDTDNFLVTVGDITG